MKNLKNKFVNNRKGFTLIELLVVIAIIGILSGIVLSSLNASRQKARTSQAQTALTGTVPIAVICGDIPDNITEPSVGVDICGTTTGSVWPPLPTGWVYDGGPGATCDAGNYDLTAGDGEFYYCAMGDGRTIECTNEGCVTS